MAYGRFKIKRGVASGKLIILGPKGAATIGRSGDNDIKIKENAISSRHCRLSGQGEHFQLEDIGSRNGTFVNGQRVEIKRLDDGDTISLGRTEILYNVFDSIEAAKAPDPSPGAAPPRDVTEVMEAMPRQPALASSDAQETPSPDLPTMPPDGTPSPLVQDVAASDADDNMIGRIAVFNNMITEAQLVGTLQQVEANPGARLGDLLVSQGFIGQPDLDVLLRIQESARQKKAADDLGRQRAEELVELALASGKVSPEQVKHARLIQQKSAQEGIDRELDEILISKNYLARADLQKMMADRGEVKIDIEIPGYDRYEFLGGGGMGAVFKARQVSMDRPVAIKILAERFRDKPRYRERFLKEARSVAKLNHENIIAGYDFGEVNGVSYFVMEYVEGQTLQDLLEQQKRLDPFQTVDIVLQVARALGHAHEKSMIHRDIKPENVLISEEESKVKLCDLGLAWQAEELDERGRGFGTPNYMSPEQIKGEPLDIRSDLYALGVMCYRMLFGKLPFYGNTPVVTMSMHLRRELQFPDETMTPLSRELTDVIATAMAKSPAQRYQNPLELIRRLELIQERNDPSAVTQAAPAVPRPIPGAVPPPPPGAPAAGNPKVIRPKRRLRARRRRR